MASGIGYRNINGLEIRFVCGTSACAYTLCAVSLLELVATSASTYDSSCSARLQVQAQRIGCKLTVSQVTCYCSDQTRLASGRAVVCHGRSV